MTKYTFGPVTSRRLGISLGVNNIPYKTCSYSCIYCQLGRTKNFLIDRREFTTGKKSLKMLSELLMSLKGMLITLHLSQMESRF